MLVPLQQPKVTEDMELNKGTRYPESLFWQFHVVCRFNKHVSSIYSTGLTSFHEIILMQNTILIMVRIYSVSELSRITFQSSSGVTQLWWFGIT